MKEKRVIALILAVIIIFGVLGTSIPAFAEGNQYNPIENTGGYDIAITGMESHSKVKIEFGVGYVEEILHIKEVGDTQNISLEKLPLGLLKFYHWVEDYEYDEYGYWQGLGEVQLTENLPEEGRSPVIRVTPYNNEAYDLQLTITGNIEEEGGGGGTESAIGKGDYTVTFQRNWSSGKTVTSKALGNKEFIVEGSEYELTKVIYEDVGEGEHSWEIYIDEYTKPSGKVLVNESQIGVTTQVDGVKITVNKAGGEPEPPAEDGIKVFVNEVPVIFPDVQPEISGTDLLTPLRFVNEDLGADVYWNEIERKAIITREDKDGTKIQIEMKPNENKMLVNGKEYPTSSKIILKGNRLLIPSEDIIKAYNDVFYESIGNFIANYTTTGIEPDGYTGEPKLEGIPTIPNFDVVGLIKLDKEGVQEEAIFGETGDGGDFGEGNAKIKGKIKPTIITYVIPLNIEIVINPNSPDGETIISPNLDISNGSNSPLNLSIEEFSNGVGNDFKNILPDGLPEGLLGGKTWTNLNNKESKEYIALAIKANDSLSWRGDTKLAENLYAITVQSIATGENISLGDIDPKGEVSLVLTGFSGSSFNAKDAEEFTFSYQIIFVVSLAD